MAADPSVSAAPPEIVVHEDVEELIRSSDLVVLATTAGEPYLTGTDAFEHGPIEPNVSLRDLSPDVITRLYTIVDDIDHVLKANAVARVLPAGQVQARHLLVLDLALTQLVGEVGRVGHLEAEGGYPPAGFRLPASGFRLPASGFRLTLHTESPGDLR
ncbi:hypothetical protein [Streptomyces sp. NPDC058697]|uniref:hypothetical protein n=1 Tax=Streptomyces sp. NPDC058697 TaxID=3346605 RepID=UPI003655884E